MSPDNEQLQRELTYGEKMVGLTFNPSGNADVQECKERFAAIIDSLQNRRHSLDQATEHTPHQVKFIESAIDKAITAQMAAVKAITYGV